MNVQSKLLTHVQRARLRSRSKSTLRAARIWLVVATRRGREVVGKKSMEVAEGGVMREEVMPSTPGGGGAMT